MSNKADETTPLFFLIAGEASGDLLGARLMLALKKKAGGKVRFAGIGGQRMEEEGIDLLFPQSELAHMGLFELAVHIPNILRRLHQTVHKIEKEKPAALITIDAPDFSFRVAKKLKGKGIPLIHYVAPTVWAWRPKRAEKIAKFLDHLLVLLPFEPPYFTKHGLPTTFVGHPLVESEVADGEGIRFREKMSIELQAPLLALLPGSRRGEIKKLMPVFKETVQKISETLPDLQIVMPTLPELKETLEAQVKDWGLPVHITISDEDKYDSFDAADGALACSGTVSVELAMAGLPTVIAYKANPLTVALYRRFIRTKYVTLLNIMRDEEVIPEFLQEDCTPGKLAEACLPFLTDEHERAKQSAQLQEIGEWLGRGSFIPSEKAAETVWQVAFPSTPKPLHVAQIIPSLTMGGAEQACVDIVAALVSRGDKATVISSGGRRVKEVKEAGGVHILRNVKTKNPFRIILNAFWLADLIRKEKIDILHARSRAPAWSAYLACKMTGCRYVTTFHAAYGFGGGLKRWYNSVMAKGERVIAISLFIAKHILDNYETKDAHIRLVNRGVNVEALDPENVTIEQKEFFAGLSGLALDDKAVLVPGRLSPIKGQDLAIRAFGVLKQRGFPFPPVMIVGDDQGRTDYTEKLKALIKEEGLEDKIKLTGGCGDMAAAYSFASLVLVPSKVPEGFGRVPVEAMAAGVPVIASSLGATQDTVIEGQTGWLLKPEDPNAWADCIEAALSLSDEQKKHMAAQARAHAAEHFDAPDMAVRTLTIYDELQEEKKNGNA